MTSHSAARASPLDDHPHRKNAQRVRRMPRSLSRNSTVRQSVLARRANSLTSRAGTEATYFPATSPIRTVVEAGT